MTAVGDGDREEDMATANGVVGSTVEAGVVGSEHAARVNNVAKTHSNRRARVAFIREMGSRLRVMVRAYETSII